MRSHQNSCWGNESNLAAKVRQHHQKLSGIRFSSIFSFWCRNNTLSSNPTRSFNENATVILRHFLFLCYGYGTQIFSGIQDQTPTECTIHNTMRSHCSFDSSCRHQMYYPQLCPIGISLGYPSSVKFEEAVAVAK